MNQSLQNTSRDVSTSLQETGTAHILAAPSCESTIQSQQRYFDAKGSTVTGGWITTPAQTFGLTVEPFSQTGLQVCMEFPVFYSVAIRRDPEADSQDGAN